MQIETLLDPIPEGIEFAYWLIFPQESQTEVFACLSSWMPSAQESVLQSTRSHIPRRCSDNLMAVLRRIHLEPYSTPRSQWSRGDFSICIGRGQDSLPSSFVK